MTSVCLHSSVETNSCYLFRRPGRYALLFQAAGSLCGPTTMVGRLMAIHRKFCLLDVTLPLCAMILYLAP